MSWSHRIMRDSDGTLTIREVYYTDGEIVGWTGPMEPSGYPEDPITGEPARDTEAMLSLKWDLAKFQAACCFPILDEVKLREIAEDNRKKTKTNPNKLKLLED